MFYLRYVILVDRGRPIVDEALVVVVSTNRQPSLIRDVYIYPITGRFTVRGAESVVATRVVSPPEESPQV